MDVPEFLIGVIFVAIGVIGLHISWGDRDRQPPDYRVPSALVALVSLGMVAIGVLRIASAF